MILQHLQMLKKKVANSPEKTILIMANFYPKKIGQSFAKDTNTQFKYLATNVGDKGITSYFDLFDYLVIELTQ